LIYIRHRVPACGTNLYVLFVNISGTHTHDSESLSYSERNVFLIWTNKSTGFYNVQTDRAWLKFVTKRKLFSIFISYFISDISQYQQIEYTFFYKNICGLNSTVLCYDRTLSGAVAEVSKLHSKRRVLKETQDACFTSHRFLNSCAFVLYTVYINIYFLLCVCVLVLSDF